MLNQIKSELQIKMALMECFCDVHQPQAYGADNYADLLVSLQEAAQDGHDVYASSGERLQYTDEFFDLQEAMAKVESCLELLQSYEQARAKII
ncbi:hypothetical protein [Conchiformibius steedae]|uniref:hypothetical protein n=1 Tax=Conchiformibius steedae TaxID=153493 RepID=UPI0026EBA420|nr:hypothetical protein [Conchiformibius steedae]